MGEAFGGPPNVFVKRYRYERLEQRIKQAFRGTLFGRSRARREYEFLVEMRNRRIPTVRPIAFGEDYGYAFLQASFLITEGADGFRSMDVFALNAVGPKALKRSQRRELARGLAVTIRKMHDAGVRHGGLFWRNILLSTGSDGGYDFLLIDPDTHGRMSASRVPDAAVVSDLSELVASGIALGRRAGLSAFMKSYFQVSRLTVDQRNLTLRIIERAHTLAPSERRRMAVTEVIEWLRQHAGNARRGDRSARVFGSVDEFFEQMCSDPTVSADASPSSRVIRFSFSGADGAFDRTIVVDGERATMSLARQAEHDLEIRTDPETWLALISGHADAYPRLRAGRFRMEGDPAALCVLMEYLDRSELTRLST